MGLREGAQELQTMPAETAPVSHYSRQDAARILGIPPQQIAAWLRAGLLAAGETFSFRDLVHMRRLRDLRRTRMSVRSIRSSVEAMQRVVGLADPLRDGAAMQRGTRLVFRHSGALLDPLTQQLGFDFDMAAPRPQLSLCRRDLAATAAHEFREQARANDLFQQAVALEESPETIPAAADLYREVLAIAPRHAAASINLGTILYNQRRYAEAEALYRAAAEIDPDYALAFFDLGNVLDELRRLPEAIAAYRRALQLVPQYADAHYNLALALERSGEGRSALKHWMAYVKLDPAGAWAAHARIQAKRILATERLAIVSRFGRVVELD